MTVQNATPALLDHFTPHVDFGLREQLLTGTRPGGIGAKLDELPAAFRAPLEVPSPLRPREFAPGFDEILAHAPWTVLGRRPGRELVLGAAGRFWTAFSAWESIAAREFPAFSRPRRGTIAIAFVHQPYDEEQALLTFEARATTTDPVGYRWAGWYWQAVEPTARSVIRRLLRWVAS
ncbi:hypothetical protein [Amycolatopsis alkalitolerans]|uniref:DUF2867 domain-containing protein n=1 Tax=Amycolatopsis alkalitolerans TaxID=2547244 RepID=A0A5C4M7N4_9PSEU|nr:hypothetical protein [Amycolatopsis alkalitolerans]TNC28061.1 hypothetical protein FG385_06420 [Amycolatopsis alkalitolerans]